MTVSDSALAPLSLGERTSAAIDAIKAAVITTPGRHITVSNSWAAEICDVLAALAARAAAPVPRVTIEMAEEQHRVMDWLDELSARHEERMARIRTTAAPVAGDEWQYESMRFLAHKLRNMTASSFDRDVCADAAGWLKKLSTPPPAAARVGNDRT